MTPDRIGILCYPSLGGSGKIATALGELLVRAGVETHLISYERPIALAEGLRFHRVDVGAYPLLRYPPYDLALATKCVELYERYDLRLFHAHYALPHALAVALADEMLGGGRLRLVTTLHGTDITVVGADASYRRTVLHGLRRSTIVTAVSESLARDTRRKLAFDGDIRVIPNFVDAEHFAPGSGPRWPDREPGAPRRLVHVSNFRPLKRVASILRAVALLAAELPVQVSFVGDGPDHASAVALAAELGLADRVEFAGVQPDPLPWLRDADLYLSASETESFGLSLLEALACGVPVVAPAVGGLPATCGEPVPGRLVPDAGPEALAAAAAVLSTDALAYTRACGRARRRAVEAFPPRAALAAYRAAYRDALST